MKLTKNLKLIPFFFDAGSYGPALMFLIAIWALLRGRFVEAGAGEALLQHYGVNVRCLVAIPLLILGEASLHKAALRFVPLVAEDYFLVCLKDALEHPAVLRLRGILWPITTPVERSAGHLKTDGFLPTYVPKYPQ